jgi:hypothetical protein
MFIQSSMDQNNYNELSIIEENIASCALFLGKFKEAEDILIKIKNQKSEFVGENGLPIADIEE